MSDKSRSLTTLFAAPSTTPADLTPPIPLQPSIHIGLEPGEGEEHSICMVNGEFTRTEDVRFSPYLHGLHYGTNVIGGTGGWYDPATNQHHAFRLPDTVWRLIANAQAVGMRGPFPNQMMVVVGWFLTLMGLNLSELVKSPDIYCRPVMLADGVRLGVGSVSKGTALGLTRDLTDYLPKSGISLLFPGMLFRRSNPSMGLPVVKSASNYALSHFWKTVIAPMFGCQEVLTLNWDGQEVSETTGSVPIGIIYRAGQKPILQFPRDEAWRLNSITLSTVLWIALRMGWDLDITQVTVEKMAKWDEIWLLGTWTGPGPVTNVQLDPSFLRGEPRVPANVFRDGVGTQYADWLRENLRPVSGKDRNWRYSTEPGYAGTRLADAYWAVVRNPDGLAELGLGGLIAQIPSDWRMRIEPRAAVDNQGPEPYEVP